MLLSFDRVIDSVSVIFNKSEVDRKIRSSKRDPHPLKMVGNLATSLHLPFILFTPGVWP